MGIRRVFVIWTHPLFHESVRLLLKHPDIIWVGAASEFETAHEEIMALHPDTVLFEKTKDGIPVNMIEILEVEPWDMRIIGLSLDDNEMSLYHREHQTVVEAGDLLQFVLG
jgi:DNA-binding NarL/FixJ family response regulator